MTDAMFSPDAQGAEHNADRQHDPIIAVEGGRVDAARRQQSGNAQHDYRVENVGADDIANRHIILTL
ncbi:hypothetical protein D3C80_2163220 [compost metagenome]